MSTSVVDEPFLPVNGVVTESQTSEEEFTSEQFKVLDAHARLLVRDLHKPNPRVYWSDLLLTAFTGWAAFGLAVYLPLFSPGMVASTALAVFALYRGLCFMHELSHQTRRTLPGFEAAFNVLIGYPLLMPSFVYLGVHQDHHKVAFYGTSKDPEYMPFAQSSLMTTVFAVESFFIPIVLLIRFLLLTPLGLISPRVHRWLVVYLSSLTMNLRYRREATQQLLSRVRLHGAIVWFGWMGLIALVVRGAVSWRVFLVWLLVDGMVSFINSLRTLGAHAYESTGHPMDRMGQLLDSIDHPGAFWTELWAPVGLRFHALHHYFPGVPYHSLPEAYRRLVGTLPIQATYQRMTSPSLPISLKRLFVKGLRAFKR